MPRCFSVIVGVVLLGTSIGVAQDSPPRPAVPLEPISAILDALKTHRIVALGEGAHGNEQVTPSGWR